MQDLRRRSLGLAFLADEIQAGANRFKVDLPFEALDQIEQARQLEPSSKFVSSCNFQHVLGNVERINVGHLRRYGAGQTTNAASDLDDGMLGGVAYTQ